MKIPAKLMMVTVLLTMNVEEIQYAAETIVKDPNCLLMSAAAKNQVDDTFYIISYVLNHYKMVDFF